MQNDQRRRAHPTLRPASSSANVTSAVGMEESANAARARRQVLYTRTIVWVTGLICLALLLGSLAQAWSNSRLAQQVQDAQRQYQQTLAHHNNLQKQVDHYRDPFVIESEARQQLGYVRPGEHSVLIVSPVGSPAQNRPAPPKSSSSGGFWQAWWTLFFGS